MKQEWFADLVRDWNASIKWSERDLKKATALLAEISTLYGGEVVWDCPEDECLARTYAIEKAELALQARMTVYANRIEKHISAGYYPHHSRQFKTPFDFLEPSRFFPTVDLNMASYEELEHLPGLGMASAERIMEARNRLGRFSDKQEIRSVKGINKQVFEKLEDAVYVSAQQPTCRLLDSTGVLFLQQPTFENFVAMLVNGIQVYDAPYAEKTKRTVPEIVIAELHDLAKELCTQEATKRRKVGQLGSKALEYLNSIKEAEQLIQEKSFGSCTGTVVASSYYLDFVNQLLPRAQKAIFLAVFFFAYPGQAGYPTHSMTKNLSEACERGVDVRVVLDKDPEGGRHGSRKINLDAFEYLSKNKIPVRLYDEIEGRLHAKVLVVDHCHVLVGSHNWTAGSIYNYDDKSIYIHSQDLGEHYRTWF